MQIFSRVQNEPARRGLVRHFELFVTTAVGFVMMFLSLEKFFPSYWASAMRLLGLQ